MRNNYRSAYGMWEPRWWLCMDSSLIFRSFMIKDGLERKWLGSMYSVLKLRAYFHSSSRDMRACKKVYVLNCLLLGWGKMVSFYGRYFKLLSVGNLIFWHSLKSNWRDAPRISIHRQFGACIKQHSLEGI